MAMLKGMGDAVVSVLAEEGVPARMRKVEVCDEFCGIGGPIPEIWKIHGLTVEKGVNAVQGMI